MQASAGSFLQIYDDSSILLNTPQIWCPFFRSPYIAVYLRQEIATSKRGNHHTAGVAFWVITHLKIRWLPFLSSISEGGTRAPI